MVASRCQLGVEPSSAVVVRFNGPIGIQHSSTPCHIKEISLIRDTYIVMSTGKVLNMTNVNPSVFVIGPAY